MEDSDTSEKYRKFLTEQIERFEVDLCVDESARRTFINSNIVSCFHFRLWRM